MAKNTSVTETEVKTTPKAKAVEVSFGETTPYKTDETPNIDDSKVANFYTGETYGAENDNLTRPSDTGNPENTHYVPTAQEEYFNANNTMATDDRFKGYWKNNGQC